MNKIAILIPAALVVLAAPTQAAPPATSQTPQLIVKASRGRITWMSQNAYHVSITPGAYGELPVTGSLNLPPGIYCLTAVGEQNRMACKTVEVR